MIFLLSDLTDVLRDFQCKMCSKLLGSRAALQRHCKEVHNRESGFVNCPRCQKLFQNRSNLKIHMLTHSGVRPFKLVDSFDLASIRTPSLQYGYSCIFMSFIDVLKAFVQQHLPRSNVCSFTTRRCMVTLRNKCQKLSAVSPTLLTLMQAVSLMTSAS